jgi:hypothetical protein
MADEVHAGTQVFASVSEDTIAARIEREMDFLMTTGPDGLTPPPTPNTRESRQRRLLFAAIARGVVAHLEAHPEAFQVVFTKVPSEHTTGEFAAHVQLKVSDV